MSHLDYKLSAQMRAMEPTIIGRQRLVFLIAVSIMSIVLTLSSFFLHPKTPPLKIVDFFTMLATLFLLSMYFRKKINVRLATTLLFILLQLELSAQKLTCAMQGTPESSALIIQASFLSLLLITISLICFLKYSPTIIAAISIFTFMLCLTMDHSSILRTFLPVYIVVLVGVIIYDLFSMRAVLNMEAENRNMRQEIADFFYATGLDLDSMIAIAQISRESGKSEGMRELLSRMDPGIKARLVGGLTSIQQEDDSSRKDISAVFPMLTPTQITICQLILQDKKLAEICKITGKSEGNITSQRTRIRNVLGLESDVKLKDALLERMNSYRDTANLR